MSKALVPFSEGIYNALVRIGEYEKIKDYISDKSISEDERKPSFAGPFGEDNFFIRRDSSGKPVIDQLQIVSKNQSGEDIFFSFSELSDGTQRIINLHPFLLMLKQHNIVWIVDDLERQMHTQLSQYLIEIALRITYPDEQGQFIFTTHDTNLIDTDLLRQDEIWFANKPKSGATELYSLVEFKVREGLNLEKGYLSGRFGAVPKLGTPLIPATTDENSGDTADANLAPASA